MRIAIDSVLGFYKHRPRDDVNFKGQTGAGAGRQF